MEPPVDSSLYITLFWLIVALLCCALFSFLETSLTALRLFKLKEMAQAINNKYRSLFHTLETNPNRVLITVLVAYNLANVIAAILSDQVMERVTKSLNLPETLGFAISIFITTTTILFADLIPKNLAISHGDKLFSSTLWMTNVLYYMFYPFATFLSKFTDAATRLIGGAYAAETTEAVTSEKEIQFLIDYINEKGLMERHKTAMLKSIFELGTTAIKEIMVPETSVVSINVDSTQQEAFERFSTYQFTRMPVFEGQPDNIIGIIHLKDFFQLLSKKEIKPLKDIVRPIMFVPETAKVLRVLKEFIDQRMHLAMVLNEYGSIVGLVTLEDVIEEIVGEISDETEIMPEKIIALKSGGWLIDASINLEELGNLLGIEFETEDALTLAGFLAERLQHVPQKGEQLAYKNYHFKVQQASPRRISQVLIYADREPEHFTTLEQ
jgi:putative hemolysin